MVLRILTATILLAASASAALRAGAAKIDITPAVDANLPMSGYGGRTQGFKGIHDPIYVRAIVVDDGTTQAAIVAWELIGVPDPWAELAADCLGDGMPAENVIGGGPQSRRADSEGEYAKKAQARRSRPSLAKSRPAGKGRVWEGTVNVSVNWRGGPGDRPRIHGEGRTRRCGCWFTMWKPIAGSTTRSTVVMGPDNYQITGDLAARPRLSSSTTRAHRSRGDAGPRIAPEQRNEEVVAVWRRGGGPESAVERDGGRMVPGRCVGEGARGGDGAGGVGDPNERGGGTSGGADGGRMPR
jgi:hypothetical protein